MCSPLLLLTLTIFHVGSQGTNMGFTSVCLGEEQPPGRSRTFCRHVKRVMASAFASPRELRYPQIHVLVTETTPLLHLLSNNTQTG